MAAGCREKSAFGAIAEALAKCHAKRAKLPSLAERAAEIRDLATATAPQRVNEYREAEGDAVYRLLLGPAFAPKRRRRHWRKRSASLARQGWRTGARVSMDTYPPTKQRPALLDLVKALGCRDGALRCDECGDWRIKASRARSTASPERSIAPRRRGSRFSSRATKRFGNGARRNRRQAIYRPHQRRR
jgi:hypothetical protein